MTDILTRSLEKVAAALRGREVSATEVMEAALARHERFGDRLRAYKYLDPDRALDAARAADNVLVREPEPPPSPASPCR